MLALDARLRITLGLSASELRPDAAGADHLYALPAADPGQLGVAPGSSVEADTLFMQPELASQYAAEILVVATRTAGFSCCHLGAVLELWVDGARWIGTAPDHLWQIGHWFSALLHVLGDDPAELSTFVWGESALRLERAGTSLTLSDPRAPTLELDLTAFTRAVLREGRRLERYLRALKLEVLAYARVSDLEAMAPLESVKPTARFVDDPRLVRAIVWHELRQLSELSTTLDAITRLQPRRN